MSPQPHTANESSQNSPGVSYHNPNNNYHYQHSNQQQQQPQQQYQSNHAYNANACRSSSPRNGKVAANPGSPNAIDSPKGARKPFKSNYRRINTDNTYPINDNAETTVASSKNNSAESLDRFIEENTLRLDVAESTSVSGSRYPASRDYDDATATTRTACANATTSSYTSANEPQSPTYERWSDHEPTSPSASASSVSSPPPPPGVYPHDIEPGPGGRTLTCPRPGVVPSPCRLDSTALLGDRSLVAEFSGMQIKYDELGDVNYYSDTSSEDGINVIINVK